MNANYLLAGTVSTNPILFILATWLVLAWRVAGYYGLDYWVLPGSRSPGSAWTITSASADCEHISSHLGRGAPKAALSGAPEHH
jgi:hypothetical protein